jgi:hypothetical protein
VLQLRSPNPHPAGSSSMQVLQRHRLLSRSPGLWIRTLAVSALEPSSQDRGREAAVKDLTAKERRTYESGEWIADSGPRCAVCGDLEDNHRTDGTCAGCSCQAFEERKP